jgi:glycosyltransferase involved in cell wall biosynthesis
LYLEPFGGVAVEAQFCGTPVITTDWGAYPETVAHGITGFRCRYLGEFLDAVEQCRGLDPVLINRRAVDRFSMGVVAHQYEAYFSRLTTLQEQGWYTEALVTA